MEAAQARARIHQEVEQIPAIRLEHFLARKARGVGLVDCIHHVAPCRREGARAAVVVIDDARRRRRPRVDHVVLALPADVADGFRQVMVERQVRARHVRQIGRDVAGADRDLPILHVLRMDEQDVIDQVQVSQQDGADEAVEVAAGNEAVACRKGRHRQSFHEEWIKRSEELA
jgi:hypothetical protein